MRTVGIKKKDLISKADKTAVKLYPQKAKSKSKSDTAAEGQESKDPEQE